MMEELVTSELSPSEQTPPKLVPEANGLRMGRKIQAGGQASVYLAEREGVQYAVKVYHQRPSSGSQFKSEIQILSKLEFRGIVPIVEVLHNTFFSEDGGEPVRVNMIVTPFFSKGDLLQHIKSHGLLSEDCCRYFAKTLLSTFLYLRSRNVMHGDIKAENIVLDDQYKPLLLDFGFAMKGTDKRTKFVTDYRYASPEAVKRTEYTFKSEVYSLGILLFYCMAGCFPFAAARVADPNYRLLLERKEQVFWSRIRQKTRMDFSEEFKQVFLQMVGSNPKNRCSLEEAIEMAWFRQREISFEEYVAYMEVERQAGPFRELIFNQ